MIPITQLKAPKNEGMKDLDKSKFTVYRKVWALILPEIRYINEFLGKKARSNNESSIVLTIPQHTSLVQFKKDELPLDLFEKISPKNSKLKALLLKEDIYITENDEKHKADENYEPELLKKNITDNQYNRLKELEAIYRIYTLKFDFDYWAYDDILKAILPEELIEQCPSAFTIAGHLAHLNLKEQYMPYRKIIGEVILEKFPNIKTVVNKTNNITSEFRTFEMEVLAGEDNFVVSQKESGCIFTFDFQKVYWNSRLATEHERLINSFKTGEVVFDVMAGVGPFAVPAGKKSCLVFANDLNPESYKYLQANINSNKVDSFVKPFNLDGRTFIQQSPQILMNFQKSMPKIKYANKLTNNKMKNNGDISDSQPKKKRMCDLHVPLFISNYVMNLPDSAINFVNEYIGLYSNGYPDMTMEEVKQLPGYKLPIINVHHFEKYKEDEIGEDVEQELERRIHAKIVEQLNYPINIEKINFHLVRQVAPCKLMYCISFELPEEVAFYKK
jgi:tRNA (guanine37-N1)-methyltransferase